MTENEKLRALLAEAWDELLAQHDSEDRIKLANRIDAALAEPALGWKTDSVFGDESVEKKVEGFYLSVYPDPAGDGEWCWSLSRSEVADSGSCPTKEEAMAEVTKEMERHR
jgi:hypothetical protein